MSLFPLDQLAGSTSVIPMLTEAGPTQPFFAPASGGGGGGGGPILTCSTLITNGGAGADIAPAGDFLMSSSTMTEVLFQGDLAGGSAMGVQANTTANADLSFAISSVNSTTPFTGVGSWVAVESDGDGYLNMGAQNDGTSYIAAYTYNGQNVPSTLNIWADAVNLSSLNVSSINGAAPGGGSVPADLTLSSLTVSSCLTAANGGVSAKNLGVSGTTLGVDLFQGPTSAPFMTDLLYFQNVSTMSNYTNPATNAASLPYPNIYGIFENAQTTAGGNASFAADMLMGNLYLTGSVGASGPFAKASLSSDNNGSILVSSLKASTINSPAIFIQSGFPVPLFQNGRFTMPVAASNVIETDIVFSDTTWGAWAGYDGAVNQAVSSIGTQVLSRSTFAVYAQGGLGVSWQVLGN